MQEAAQRIRLIEGSLRCFVYGLLSLVPLVGLVAAVLAFREHFKVRSESGEAWNPARRYLVAGRCLASLGGVITLVILGLIVVAFIFS